jgi:hypothetical protein
MSSPTLTPASIKTHMSRELDVMILFRAYFNHNKAAQINKIQEAVEVGNLYRQPIARK